MNGSPAVDEAGTIYGTATFAGMGSSAFAMGSDGVEKWRTPLGNVGTLDQGGVVIGLDGSIIVTVKRAPGKQPEESSLCLREELSNGITALRKM